MLIIFTGAGFPDKFIELVWYDGILKYISEQPVDEIVNFSLTFGSDNIWKYILNRVPRYKLTELYHYYNNHRDSIRFLFFVKYLARISIIHNIRELFDILYENHKETFLLYVFKKNSTPGMQYLSKNGKDVYHDIWGCAPVVRIKTVYYLMPVITQKMIYQIIVQGFIDQRYHCYIDFYNVGKMTTYNSMILIERYLNTTNYSEFVRGVIDTGISESSRNILEMIYDRCPNNVKFEIRNFLDYPDSMANIY